LGLFDWLFNILGPVTVGAVATTILIVRVLFQKRRVGQRGIWRRNRRMIIQLASISIMYIIVWIPSVVCSVVLLFVPNQNFFAFSTNVLSYFQYLSCLLCPFMSLIGLPEVRGSIKQIFTRINNARPFPQPATASVMVVLRRQK
jgi:hypothetical protein